MRAIVLCAGFGTRLGKLVDEVPKPMLSLGPRPMLEYILRNLARHGIREVAINLHFRPDVICNYFGSGQQLGLELTYVHEPELRGTAGSVRGLGGFLSADGPFLVHYGDVVTDQDLTAMLDFHRQRQALATLLVHRNPRSNSVLELDDEQRIVSFLERPTEEERRHRNSPWVNSGVSICDPAILGEIPADVPCDLPRHIYTKLVPARQLYAFPLTSYRCAVDSPERLQEAREAVARGLLDAGHDLANAGGKLDDA